MSNPFTAPSSPQLETGQPRIPRLGISHFLIWTAFTAVLTGISTFAMREQEMPTYFLYSQVAVSIALAASLTGLLVLFRARESWDKMMRLPGHWIVFCHASVAIMLTLVSLFRLIPGLDEPPFWATSNAWLYRLWESGWTQSIGLVGAAAYAFAAWRNRETWRWLFGAGAVFLFADTLLPVGVNYFSVAGAGGTQLGVSIGSICNYLLNAVMASVLLLADYRGERRDWVHWLGATLTIGSLVMSSSWYIALLTSSVF